MKGERWYKGTLEVLDNLGSYSGKYQTAISAMAGKKKISQSKEKYSSGKRDQNPVL